MINLTNEEAIHALLADVYRQSLSVAGENQRLKEENDILKAENEQLRASSSTGDSDGVS